MTNQQLSPAVKKALQQALVDLTGLNPLGKQMHWNIKSSRFRALYLQLGEIVGEVYVAPDDVAERPAVPGGVPDARAATAVVASGLEQFDTSYLSMDEVHS